MIQLLIYKHQEKENSQEPPQKYRLLTFVSSVHRPDIYMADGGVLKGKDYFLKFKFEEQGYKGAQGIIDLSRKNLPRLLTAIQEANNYEIYTYKAIKAIFTRLEQQSSFEEIVNNSNLRGPDYYKEQN